MAATPFKYDSKDDCPDKAKHTNCPSGYLGWHDWAEKKRRTHRQKRCPTCGFWSIWVPKKQRKEPTP
jgi:hypothetical protein